MLRATNLIGFGDRPVRATGVTTALSFNAQTGQDAAASSYTWTGASIGAADDNRYCILCAAAFDNTDNSYDTLNATINGNSMTSLTSVEGATGLDEVQVHAWIYALATGTTANFVVSTGSGTWDTVVLASYRLIHADGTPFDTGGHTGTVDAMNINTSAGGCALGVSFTLNSTATTWTGLTEDFDQDYRSGEYWSGAHETGLASTETPRTIASSAIDIDSVGLTISWD